MMAGIWILGCLCLICLLFLLVLLHDLKAINGQLKYKNQQHSHFEVYVQSPFRQIKQLQQHINALYEDIWLTEEKAQKKEREMQTLMSGISHDIRTPLTSMQGYLELIEEVVDEDEKKKYLSIVSYRLETLKTILEDWFMHSRLNDQAYVIVKEKLDLNALICQVLASYYEEFEQKGMEPVSIFTQDPWIVEANQEMMIRLFQNLISNALKHGQGKLMITQAGTTLTFANALEDGVQLDPERLFDRFYKGDRSRHQDSTGLGLSIVQKVAEVHGWTIRADLQGRILSIRLDIG